MRPIEKRIEPRSLTEHRCQPFADYDNYRQKDDLRASLVEEQGGLCCYCMQRIAAHESRMKIEHWLCQEDNEEHQLNYQNLLGACLGSKGKPRKLQHCDSYKGKLPLSRNPANAQHHVDRDLHYLADGTIRCSNAKFDQQLNNVLNLNVETLRNNRKAVLDGLKAWAQKTGRLRRQDITRELRDRAFQEYGQVAVYWLKKRLARI